MYDFVQTLSGLFAFYKPDKNLIIELKVARQTIMEQQKELDALRPLKNVFAREQKRGGFTYGENIDNIAVDLLCNGETSMGISRFLILSPTSFRFFCSAL